MRDTLIIAPPPTPNGDLHVGHLCGPYFGADVFRRYLTLRGHTCITALSVDVNQSYVVTTAERLGKDPGALAVKSHQEVSETLDMADIDFDIVGFPDRAYTAYISDWFAALYERNIFQRQTRPYPYDVVRKRFMFESYASGTCPVCLSGTNGNICEACGHPNDARDLLGLYPTGGAPGDPIEMRPVEQYVLSLEDWREPLRDYLDTAIPERRPSLQRLIDELFARRLPDFPITFPSQWGIPAPFPNADGLVLNVWAEILPGHYHWLEQAASSKNMTFPTDADYVQYLGFDNSFFYLIAHVALAMAAKKCGVRSVLPAAIVTNEFYQLDNFKFSTSQGHLIWGRDLLAEISADEARFYFAWSNPDYSQANFTMEDMERVLNRKLRAPLKTIRAGLQAVTVPAQVQDTVWSTALYSRFESVYDIGRQNLRAAAQTVANGLSILIRQMDAGAAPSELCASARAIAVGLAPLSPGLAAELWQLSGGVGRITWPQSEQLSQVA
ncbi:class I tRNA ligase family protein [Puniceibacterium sediminis]|uniref:Methionyl-tRNA synthetase n=1 Tax=Puniceibacterium sediminis TaxID=1608407 RepID=A0A238YVH4_9RHOB|nr:class I tRNA ligase family protein [Puniceibacterium sediminis]SNR74644.1 methionyl-tRNA synthetase [Puniceibacterium sediminis]